MDTDTDCIVIGSGMAGSIIAARCGAAGMRTLVLETGRTISQAPPKPGGTLQRVRQKLANLSRPDPDGERWPSNILLRPSKDARWRALRAVIARGPGGSGRIYGAALGRARRTDFEVSHDPSAWHDEAMRALPNDWPIDFGEFSEFYREAEALLQPAGTRDPLDPDDDAQLVAPPPLSPAQGRIVEALQANGRNPYRMHVGIAYKPGCSECQGTTCPRDCKAHGFNRVLQPALQDGTFVTLVENMSARSLRRESDGMLTVSARDASGAETMFRSPRVVLAAGALNSPLILQRSADLWGGEVPDLVGEGLMFHASEIFAVSGFAPGTLYGPRKVLAFRDNYREGPMPLAECQSLGMVAQPGLVVNFLDQRLAAMGLPSNAAVKLALRVPARFAARRYTEAEMFTAALEDLPYARNKVESVVDADGVEHIAVTYAAAPEMLARVERFRDLMREAFAPLDVSFFNSPGEPNLGHPMGTCRMGHDRANSVTRPDGQVWDQPGLFVADASVFPSSLGINPALTVAANALRMANSLTQESTSIRLEGANLGA